MCFHKTCLTKTIFDIFKTITYGHVVTMKIYRDACYAALLRAREPRYELRVG